MRPPLILSLTMLIAGQPALAATDCSDLTALTLPGINIQNADRVAAGDFTPPNAPKPLQVRELCRVVAVATPTSDSEIHFEVWIPAGDNWNGKLLGTGNGGFSGAINYAAMAVALARGYATTGNDTGHTGDQMEFGRGHPEKIADWAYRAIHVTAQAAKLLIRDLRGRFPAHAYFQGCSTGGQQALSEAQRFPDDYDGIIAGAPGYDRIRLIAGFLWSWAATHNSNGEPVLTQAQLSRLTHDAVARCDAADGLQDGLIDDPRRCDFDPAAARRGGGPTCSTPRNRCASVCFAISPSATPPGTGAHSTGTGISSLSKPGFQT